MARHPDWIKGRLRFTLRQIQIYAQSLIDGTLWSPRVSLVTRNRVGSALVLDSRLPAVDRDAGSRTVAEHIRTLREMGYEVHFRPLDGLDVPRYSAVLRRMGVQLDAGIGSASLRRWLKRYGGELRFVLMNRPEVAQAWLGVVRQGTEAPIIYYGHDLHFARMRMQAEGLADTAMAAAADRMEAAEREIWRDVDVITYPTAEETAVVQSMEAKRTVRALQAYCYDAFADRASAPPERTIMYVGSFQHPPNIDAALWLARDVFPLVRGQVPGARLVIAGSNPTAEILAVSQDDVEVAGWLSSEELDALYARARAAAVPLRIGAGIKLKVVEALVKGLPLVTTGIGGQGLPDLPAPIHNDAQGFADALTSVLLLSEDAWLAASRAGVAYARDRFSRAAMVQSLQAAIAAARQLDGAVG